MNLEDLSRLSEAELRAKANEKLAKLEVRFQDLPVYEEGSVLSEAQFFIDEIERRKQSQTGRRDLLLELVVILLIGAELYYGIRGGNQQLEVLLTLKASADQQLVVLQNLNASAGETARTMKALADKQDLVLATQQQTLQLTAQMNGALQNQLGLNFAPALTLIYNESAKKLSYYNFGKTNVFLWGQQLEGEQREMNPQPRIIVPGTAFETPEEDFLKARSQTIPKGGNETLHLDIYLKTANGKKHTANFLLILEWKNDAMTIRTQFVGIKPEGW